MMSLQRIWLKNCLFGEKWIVLITIWEICLRQRWLQPIIWNFKNIWQKSRVFRFWSQMYKCDDKKRRFFEYIVDLYIMSDRKKSTKINPTIITVSWAPQVSWRILRMDLFRKFCDPINFSRYILLPLPTTNSVCCVTFLKILFLFHLLRIDWSCEEFHWLKSETFWPLRTNWKSDPICIFTPWYAVYIYWY